MNTYFVQCRIKTLLTLREPFTYRGYRFSPWRFDHRRGLPEGGWCATKEIEADNCDAALEDYFLGLYSYIDRIAFVGQCFTVVEGQPFLIWRYDKNPDREFFFWCSWDVPAVPLAFSRDQKSALDKLDEYDEKGDAFCLLREATNSCTLYSRFAMLCASLEALAGQNRGKKGKLYTDHKYMREVILKDDELHDRLFGPGVGIRNKMLHGARIDWISEENRSSPLIESVYGAIIKYFYDIYDVEINLNVVRPQRHPIGNYEFVNLWLRPRDSQISMDLPTIYDGLGEVTSANMAELIGQKLGPFKDYSCIEGGRPDY